MSINRIITLDEYSKITAVRYTADTDYVLKERQHICDIGKRGQLRQSDGSFIDDPNVALVRLRGRVIRNAQEAYKEYLEMEKMLGADSVEAVAAKEAYLRINETSPDKCRYELETELAQAEADAELYMTIYLDSEGAW